MGRRRRVRKCGALLQEVASSLERQPEQSLYRDVRTVFEEMNDTTIYIPAFDIALNLH